MTNIELENRIVELERALRIAITDKCSFCCGESFESKGFEITPELDKLGKYYHPSKIQTTGTQWGMTCQAQELCRIFYNSYNKA